MGEFAARAVAAMTGTLAPRDVAGRTNVLLLGVGDEEHAAHDLTDAIIVASVEPATESVVLLSIPRDVYLTDAEGAAPARINALYSQRKRARLREGASATGASLLAMRDVADDLEKRLALPIHGIIKMDFTGFEKLIDAFGGVDIEVPRPLTDHAYPVEEDAYGIFTIEAGPQHLDGVTALRYARSRHSTSDFDRSDRQQQILRGLMEKAQRGDIFRTLGMIDPLRESLRGHVEWTFLPAELLGIAGSLLTLHSENVIRMQLNTRTGGLADAAPGGFIYHPDPSVAGSGSTLLPVSLSGKASDWGQIRTLATLLFSHRDLYLAHPVIAMTNEPKARAQARKLRNELLRYGFFVAQTEEVAATDAASLLQARGGTPSAASLFAAMSGLPFTWRSETRESLAPEITIALDGDYRFAPFEKKLSAE